MTHTTKQSDTQIDKSDRSSFPQTDKEKLDYLLSGRALKFPEFSSDCKQTPEECRVHTLDASLIEVVVEEFDGNFTLPLIIENAVITGKLNLKYVTFNDEVKFERSIFLERPDFSFATFKRSANFDGSQFCQGADFRAAHALYDFQLRYTHFEQESSFMDLRVDEVFRAEGAHFHKVTFEQAEFAKRALFCPQNSDNPQARPVQVQFEEDADFTNIHIKGAAHFEGALFKKMANFRGAVIDDSAYFRCYVKNTRPGEKASELEFIKTCFEGNAVFYGIQIQGTAYFHGAHFQQEANFERARVAGHMLFQTLERKDRNTEAGRIRQATVKVIFTGEANFLAAQIGGNAEFDGASFENDVYFERMTVEDNLYLRSFLDVHEDKVKCEFKGLVKFLGCHIKGDAEFKGTQFTGLTRKLKGLPSEADFESMHVEGNLFFDHSYEGKDVGKVLFQMPVSFINAHFKGQAKFFEARFESEADFTNLEIDGTMTLEGTEFTETADFTSAHFKNQANFGGVHFNNEVDFTDLEIDGAAFFNEATFNNQVTIFRAARFKSLDLTDAVFRHRVIENIFTKKRSSLLYSKKRIWHRKLSDGNIDMRGLVYEHIDVDLEHLLLSLDPYGRQPYTLLEKNYRSVGFDREADLVYYDGKCRAGLQLWRRAFNRKDSAKDTTSFKDRGTERRDTSLPVTWFNASRRKLSALLLACFSATQRKLFRYGVRPLRLFVLSLLVLLLGLYMFKHDGSIMYKDKKDRLNDAYHQTTWREAFNMSLRQFIPIVEIPPGSDWIPSDQPAPLLGRYNISYAGYATIHRLLGVILIPLGVAALTGFLQRRDKPGK